MAKVEPLGFETLRGGENKRSGERGKRRRKEKREKKKEWNTDKGHSRKSPLRLEAAIFHVKG